MSQHSEVQAIHRQSVPIDMLPSETPKSIIRKVNMFPSEYNLDLVGKKANYEYIAHGFLEELRATAKSDPHAQDSMVAGDAGGTSDGVFDELHPLMHKIRISVHNYLRELCKLTLITVVGMNTRNERMANRNMGIPKYVTSVLYDLDNRPRLCFMYRPTFDTVADGRIHPNHKEELDSLLHWMVVGSSVHTPCFVLEGNSRQMRLSVANHDKDSNEKVFEFSSSNILSTQAGAVCAMGAVKSICLSLTKKGRRSAIPLNTYYEVDVWDLRTDIDNTYLSWVERRTNEFGNEPL